QSAVGLMKKPTPSPVSTFDCRLPTADCRLPTADCLLYPDHVDRLLGLVTARGAQHPHDRGNIGIIAAIADGDVIGPSQHGVGRVEFDPAIMLAAPDPYPGVHCIGALEPRL